jgi:release factor glutamine methyltransferase
MLVERALELPLCDQARALDVGTGSGCIAISLKAERPRWQVTATDCSPEALEIACANARDLAAAVDFVAGNLGEEVSGPFHLVTANLPYIPTGRLAELPLEVQHDPPLALDGGPDGLGLVRRLVADLPRLLAPGSWALLELYEGQASEVAELAAAKGLTFEAILRDLGGAERVVVLRRSQ